MTANPPGRRGFLRAGATTAAALIAWTRARADAPPAIPSEMQEQGAPLLSPPYGQPSPFERNVIRRVRVMPSIPSVGSSLSPLADLHGIITPGGLHYERHHAGVPHIDPAQHRLLVHGLVERPLLFTMDDITRFPSVSRIHFLECSGNTPFWGGVSPALSVQQSHGLLSCSEWTGVRLTDLLGEVGLLPQAKWMLAEGGDAAAMTRSIPIEKVLDDAMLAYAQNGEHLRSEQGYPLRLVLPGFEGNTNIKWLRRLKFGDQPWETREETSKYTDLLPDNKARQFAFVMEVKSVITEPSGGRTLTRPGFREIRGLAWSGHGRIARVEVSADSGGTWHDAQLQEPVLPKCLTRFRLPWSWSGQPAVLSSRATDEAGNVQPTHDALLAVRGNRGGYHYNAVHSWRVANDGSITGAA
ncbi:MAG: sulfite dehydrogenase [Acetobacteraceae bacterium]